MSRLGTIVRRTFLLGAATVAGGLAVGYYMYRQPYANPLEDNLADGEATFNPYVKIGRDGTITVYTPRAEMGQGVHTTLAALVAEELDLELADIATEHGPASWAYYNAAMLKEGGPFPFFDRGLIAESARSATGVVAKFLGQQITGGSSSITDAYDKMREAGAATRYILLSAAATKLNKPITELNMSRGAVLHEASGGKVAFSDLVESAAAIAPPSEVELRDPAQWRLLGKSQPRIDVAAKSTGKAGFGIDVRLPDMLYATVRMSPRLGAEMISFDASVAEKMKGVVKVVSLGNGVGVIADNTWRAFQAAEAIDITWGEAPYPASTADLKAKITEAAQIGDGFTLRDDGDAAAAFDSAPEDARLEAEYSVPYLAHACMEPMNATAQWKDGRLELWTGTQAPTILQMIGAREFGVDAEEVKVNTTYLGGGFGRRGEIDYPLYAMKLARETEGRPVKVVWTREEDMRHDTYRPAAVGRFRAVVDKDGPSVVDMRIACPSIIKSVLARTFPSISPAGPDKTIVEGAFDQPYDVVHYRVAGIPVDISIPVGFWRSVGNSYNGFFHECFMDEIAEKAGMDPVAMRLKLMQKHPTAVKVVEKVAEMSNWGSPLPAGSGRGIAFTLSFGSWVGEVVQVANTPAGIRIEKVWCAADVGRAIDPSILEAQMQSGIVFGLSSAMGQQITFADGEVEQSNFHDYDAMRIGQAPAIEVAILENSDLMGGAGEPGTPPSIPALANAIYSATGKRHRELPLSKYLDFVA